MGLFERKISSTLKCISKLVEIGTFKYTPNSTFGESVKWLKFGDKVEFSINLRKSQSTSCEYLAFFSSNLRHLTHSSYLLLSFPVTDIWVKTHMRGEGQKVVKVFFCFTSTCSLYLPMPFWKLKMFSTITIFKRHYLKNPAYGRR